jgi:hypothetical protein
MLDGLRAGKFHTVIAWHPDRLHRRPAELEEFIEILEGAGADVVTVQSGDIDFATPSGRMVARMLGATARYEVERIGERVRRKHRELAEAGRPVGGGSRPFGFEDDRMTLQPEEAAHIREAARRLLAGDSLWAICRDWNAAGILTTTGKPWRTHSLRRLLLSARIVGLREHAGATYPAVWPAIIDARSHERIRRILTSPARRNHTGPGRRYLLTGLAYCGLCGAKLVARPRGDHRRCYVCAPGPNFSGCGKIRILAEPFERDVAYWAHAVLGDLDHDPHGPAKRSATNGETDVLFDRQHELEERRDEFMSDRVSGLITRDAMLAGVRAIEAEISAIHRQIQKLAHPSTGPTWAELIEQAGTAVPPWATDTPDAADWEWWRTLIEATADRIVVHPARVRGSRFDASRIEIHSSVPDAYQRRVEELRASGVSPSEAQRILEAE